MLTRTVIGCRQRYSNAPSSSMDADGGGQHSVRHSSNSSSSAVDLSGTGLGILVPQSPSLQPSDNDGRTYTRRRLSWSSAEGRQDPPRLNLPEPGPSGIAVLRVEEDPLFSSVDRPLRKDSSLFSNPRPDASSTSLLSMSDSDTEAVPDDDEAHLTRKAQPKVDGRGHWSRDFSVDSERSAGVAQRPRRQYTTPSPLKRTGTAIKNAFRRASMRVADVRGHRPSIRLQDGSDGSDSDSMLDGIEETTQRDVDDRVAYRARPSVTLRGRALGFLGPTNPLRSRLYNLLIHPYTEPMILVLIIVNAVALVVQASRTLLFPSTQVPITIMGYFHAWEDFVLFVLFILFTYVVEALARICVSGLLLDPEVPTSALFSLSFSKLARTMSTNSAPNGSINTPIMRSSSLARGLTMKRLYDNLTKPFSLSSHARTPSFARVPTSMSPSSSTFQHAKCYSEDPESPPTFLSRAMKSDVPKSDSDALVSLPFRLDIQMARSKIVRNIPYLRQSWGRVDFVAMIGFWVSFVLATVGLERGTYHIGVFRALSVLRTARLLSITNGTATIMRSLKIARSLLANVVYFIIFAMVLFSIIGVQSFKGSLRRSCNLLPVLGENTTQLTQLCGGHINATTLVTSPYVQLDGTPASITKGFICPLGQVCQEGQNPFGGVESFDTVYYCDSPDSRTCLGEYCSGVLWKNLKKAVWWSYTRWFWVSLAFASLVIQATATADMSAMHQEIIDVTERIITFAFDVEIVVRIVAELPAWRNFFQHGNNLLDVILAIGCSVIQIPAIHNSSIYRWLTVFQLARFYRVILVVPRMKPLILTVFGNMYGLVNMTLFLMLINFLAALVGIQLIQGDMAGTVTMNFGQLFNSFLAVYQIFSSENWTTVLYNATDAELNLGQAVIVCMFLSCWLLFANFIVMQMFIAVINENFSVAEEAKREMQASNYSEQRRQTASSRWIRMLNPYLWLRTKSTTVNAENPSSTSVLGEETLVRHDPLPMHHRLDQRRTPSSTNSRSYHLRQNSFGLLHELFTGSEETDDIPLLDLHQVHSESRGPDDPVEYETDRYFDILATLKRDLSISKDSSDDRRTQTMDLIRKHPTYDKTFWTFPQTNRLRRLCQKIVRPSGGERIFGTPPSDVAHTFFQLAIFLAVLGNVATEAIATPLYRHNYYTQYGPMRGAWFNVTEATFGLILVVEFLIKIIADGFLFTPNAYIRGIWNILDFFIMAGVLVNVTYTLIFVGGLSRSIRALKALQALRFMTLIERMRSTFEHLILAGFTRILDAALLAVLYLIPFSVWGTNIFAGLMNECNDTSVQGIGDCTNEYVNTIYGSTFGFPVPRVWDNPAPSTKFSFDNFPASMLILFEIVSLEGWIDVMSIAMSITGQGQQPQANASQANAIFFVTYNLLGGVVILTLFVSIIIGNFSSRTGSALVTQAQREWIDLQKLIKRLKPSKRPKIRPSSPIRAWCYDRAIHKHGRWSRMMTCLFVVQIVVLMFCIAEEAYLDLFSLSLTLIYVVDTTIRLYGLGWRSFRANGWNLFDVVVASGSFTTTFIAHFYSESFNIQLLQKLFLVSIAFKLVQRVDSLNQLFKTGTASLPVILNLLALWLTLFLFFAIMYMEVFGLTKWYSGENSYQNYQTMGSAFLMLVFMSTGEGWNQFMHDYTLAYPRCTHVSYGIYQTDCGSTAWAFSMFIAWNLLSMVRTMHDRAYLPARLTVFFFFCQYIFVNMFTGVIVQSFSYVFQSTGGVLRSITRREIRAFKKAWAEFSDPNSGLLERPNLVPFLARLSGVFEVRVYPPEYSTASILAACQDKSERGNKTGGIHVRKLNKLLNKIDFGAIRRRRAVYMQIYHEANVMFYRSGGISFTDMLVLLAHHKLIDDREALGLKELEAREETLKLVAGLVGLDKVRSQLRMISLRREFLQERDNALAAARGIPAILIDAMPGTPPSPPSPPPTTTLTSRDITSPRSDRGWGWHEEHEDPTSPTGASSSSSSSQILLPSPELAARERSVRSAMRGRGRGRRGEEASDARREAGTNSLDDPDAVHSPTVRPSTTDPFSQQK
ncbi:Ion transport protein-domain-containing protein [Lanmaoa asiatica]|nr:Ion transport protein-domain-containing protein [Lanmaoa asiatica]